MDWMWKMRENEKSRMNQVSGLSVWKNGSVISWQKWELWW